MSPNLKPGEILAMVGSKDYFDIAHDGNFNVPTAPPPAGSSIKPLNYALALIRGFTPASVIDDSPITYKTPGQPSYSPSTTMGASMAKSLCARLWVPLITFPPLKSWPPMVYPFSRFCPPLRHFFLDRSHPLWTVFNPWRRRSHHAGYGYRLRGPRQLRFKNSSSPDSFCPRFHR